MNIKKTFTVLLIAGTLALIAASMPASGQEGGDPAAMLASGNYDAEKIVRKMIDLMRGQSNYSVMKMTIHNPDWPGPRVYEMRGWEDQANDKSFIRITTPASERGKAFLKIGNVFKVYIPTERENKPMTIPPSLMLQPWMGSDFTNDDLVHESSEVNDYTHKVTGVEKDVEGNVLVTVEMIPKPDAPVVWGKIVVSVRAEDYIPVKEVYYDEDGVQIRRMDLSEIKTFGSRKLPTVWEMTSLEKDKKGRKTVIEIEDMKFDIEIDPSIFTDRNLTRRDWD